MLLIFVLINLTPVQNYIVRQVAGKFAKELNTKVAIQHVRLDLLNQLVIQGLYIEDKQQDTLLYAGETKLNITDWFIVKKEVPIIKYVGLHNATANLKRSAVNGEWNFQFIIDAFPANDKKQDSTKLIEFDLEEVGLSNVRFSMNDHWIGSDMSFAVGEFNIEADNIDLEKKIIELDNIRAVATHINMRQYDGGRPASQRPVSQNVIDTTAFNKGSWSIKLSDLELKNCHFGFDNGDDAAKANEFDPNHIGVNNINIDIEDVVIEGDTITANLNNLSADERSGFVVKKLTADVRVSPTESICRNLLLITNNSRLSDYYAMHYSRFPDFNDYINKVVMVASLKKSSVDANDVAYFAPVLRQYPTILNISGDARGTVADIEAEGLNITDGATSIKGDLTMQGLPDINNTYIVYTNGQIVTSGSGLTRYAPTLKTNKTVNINAITDARFNGDFKGYIDNFIINGEINSNLGKVVSNVELDIADNTKQTTSFEGKVVVDQLDLGTLLFQPDLGIVTLNANVDGEESKATGADINFAAVIDEIHYKGYTYKDINSDGKLENKKFTGNLIISDPNLAMGFYGLFDFSEERLKIKATANVLSSNLTNLNLIKDDDVQLVADFDLDWEGVSIDNFTGYAKLYNIDLQRNNHKLDLDSVYVHATELDGGKKLSVQSNAFTADLKGQYVLSTLPNSFQYYLYGYIPNYINLPSGDAPPQDFSFHLKTYDLDSLFGILAPSLSGFDNANVDGYLNTEQQKLELSGYIPSGKVAGVTFNNTQIKSNGNFNTLSLDAKSGNIIFSDTSQKSSLQLRATLGKNKLDFKINTSSPYSVGDAVIAGTAVAYGDTLDATILPSEIFLNDKKWNIAGGNKILFTDGYLSIKDFMLRSDGQRITIHSTDNGLNQNIGINIKDLSAEEVAGIVGLAEYQIKGRINGTVNVQNLLSDMLITSKLKATNVQYGGDTVGVVSISGKYDGKKNLVDLDKTTGIHYGDQSLTIGGRISFDSTKKEYINGEAKLNKAQLSWLQPLLVGFVSELDGSLDGSVRIRGTSTEPDIDGNINLSNAVVRIDFLGAKYSIEKAVAFIDEKNIDLGKMNIKDVYGNDAYLTGGISHNHFDKMRLNLSITSDKLEIINLEPNESELFYGNLIAKFKGLSITGPFNDINIRINGAEPADKSHLYLPIGTDDEDGGAYNYITFKNDADSVVVEEKQSNKLSIHIDALLNPLAEITMIMDPSTGDAINAKGNGNISMDIPPNDDIRMYGRYTLEGGSYTFTLPQLFFKRNFDLNTGSVIQFEGPISNTRLNVAGIYKTRARLYDLLTSQEQNLLTSLSDREQQQTKANSLIDVMLYMKGSLATPEISFDIVLPDKSTEGTIAANKLKSINQNEKELFDQVASLLLFNTFMTNSGFESGAGTGVVNNVSDIFSGTASSQLTNLISKLTGDDDIAINLKYQQYSLNNTDISNRNTFSLQVRKNLLKDRLSIEVGSSVDWGKPTAANSSSSKFNPVGDFRLQYLFREGGNLRGNIFRTSSYDVLAEQNIARGGVGLSWRRSFNTLKGFLGQPEREQLGVKSE